MEKKITLNLFVGTPAYSSLVHTDYLHSIMSYHEIKLPVTIMTLGNESLITRGRNTVISYFYYDKRFTHLLFLDADIYLHANELIKLIAHEKDVIGAPVRLKGYNKFDNSPIYNTGNLIENIGDGLVTMDRLGTAVLMLSRNAVDALVEKAIKDGDVYGGNTHTRGDANDEITQYDIFKTGVFDGEYLSEDYYVCRVLRELGFPTYVDTNVQTKHNGMFSF